VSVLLQQKGIDVNITNSIQRTSLHHVVGLDNAEEAILGLISHGANVNAKDRSGCTPLHMAAINGRLGSIKILMSNGADSSITSNVNDTARTLAESNGHVFVVDFFDKPPNSPVLPSIGGAGKGKEKEKEPEVKDDSKAIIKNKDNKTEVKLAEKESQIADLELEIARLQSETMALQIKIEQQEQQNTASSTQLPDLQQKLKVTQGETSKMKEEFDNYKTQMQTQMSERQVEITKIKEESAKWKEESAKIKEESAKWKEESAKIKEESAKWKEGSAKTKEESAKWKEESAKIKEESAKWKEEETKLKEENEDLKTKLRRSNALVAEMKQQVDQKIKSRTDMENSLAKHEEENIKLFKDREDLLVLQSKFKLTWVPDDFVNECLICNIKFTVTSRKHHCRLCGRIYCTKCADKKVPIPALGYKDEVRVCDKCFEIVQRQI